MEKLLKFLIMENLPDSGEPVLKENLMHNVNLDVMDLKKAWRLDIFEKSLIDLNEKQFIFVNNEKETVAATQYGVNKGTQSI
jgi:hypothetical protein